MIYSTGVFMLKNRTEIINFLIEKFGYRTYLEIGVQNINNNFIKIHAPIKHGVDPIKESMATHVMVSDKFFEQNKATYDIIFIDGLHEYKQVVRDIKNSLDILNVNGTIVLHDCNPTTEKMQIVPRVQSEWTGDVWKAFIDIRHNIKNLNLFVLDCDYGVGIIRRAQRTTKFDLKVDPEVLTYKEFDKNRKHWLRLVTPDKLKEML